MFVAGFRLALIAVGAYLAYRSFRIFQEHRYGPMDHMYEPTYEEPRSRGRCVICNNEVEPSDKYKNSCECWAHKGCMSLIKEEGQTVCPKCKKSLNNGRGRPENGTANSSRSFDGTSTTRRFV